MSRFRAFFGPTFPSDVEGAAVTLGASQSNIDERTPPPDRAPYPTRMRVILVLSIISWIAVLAIAGALLGW